MANNNVQAPESESLNIHEAFFLKNKKLILGAIVAIIVIIAGIFVYNNQIAGHVRTKQALCWVKVRLTSTMRCMIRLSMAMVLAM